MNTIIKNISRKRDDLLSRVTDPTEIESIQRTARDSKIKVIEFLYKCQNYYQLFKLKDWINSFGSLLNDNLKEDDVSDTAKLSSTDPTDKIDEDSKVLENNPNINWGDLNFPRSDKGGPINPSNYKINRVKYLADMRCGYCGEFKIGVFTPFVHKESYYDRLEKDYDPIYETNLLENDQNKAKELGSSGSIANNPNNINETKPLLIEHKGQV